MGVVRYPYETLIKSLCYDIRTIVRVENTVKLFYVKDEVKGK